MLHRGHRAAPAAAPSRRMSSSAPVSAKLAVWIQPASPRASWLIAFRVKSKPSRANPWARLTARKSGPATAPPATAHRAADRDAGAAERRWRGAVNVSVMAGPSSLRRCHSYDRRRSADSSLPPVCTGSHTARSLLLRASGTADLGANGYLSPRSQNSMDPAGRVSVAPHTVGIINVQKSPQRATVDLGCSFGTRQLQALRLTQKGPTRIS